MKSWWTHSPSPTIKPTEKSQRDCALCSRLFAVSTSMSSTVPSSMMITYSALAASVQKTSAGGAAISSSEAQTAAHRESTLSSRMKLTATYMAKNTSVTLLSTVTLDPNSAKAAADAYTSGTPLYA